ncbi:hypothetical protein CYLTODRAFT_443280 [Cylindrobasidium torrendii FP15055 ss-10]|uniref:Uncharacterized protein n=1 Tax=Cylindrobasidium torrendii FP15055 ss-10 TaxID=1314674 RepID=A0A0D7BEH2_9AGAR|nr:hypothetical protein CYLTODRAFT_443280 [Cylindrobasidium torrendii FP15055 ss-10]
MAHQDSRAFTTIAHSERESSSMEDDYNMDVTMEEVVSSSSTSSTDEGDDDEEEEEDIPPPPTYYRRATLGHSPSPAFYAKPTYSQSTTSSSANDGRSYVKSVSAHTTRSYAFARNKECEVSRLADGLARIGLSAN